MRFLQIVLVSLLIMISVDASANWVSKHGLTSAQYQFEFDSYKKKGYRLTKVSGYTVGKNVFYAAIWEDTPGPAWVARHGLTSTNYQKEFNYWVKRGYRLSHVDGYTVSGQSYYAAIWELKSGPSWVARHGLSASAFQSQFNYWVGRGYRLTHISGYEVNKQDQYAAIWERQSGPAWQARYGMTAATFQSAFDQYVGQGYRLIDLSGYDVNGVTLFAAIWEQSAGPSWRSQFNIAADQYQTEFNAKLYEGFELVSVSGYVRNTEANYATIWRSVGLESGERESIDYQINDFMTMYNVPALSIAITKDEKLVYAKAYGLADIATGEKATTENLFRIASISKPITSAAIFKLVEANQLSLDQTVFGPDGILGTTYGAFTYSNELKAITVRHLLQHTSGGWPNDAYDPMLLTIPMSESKFIGWALDYYPLSHYPGTYFSYSNFGYYLLGRVIEKTTGMSYEDYVYQALLQPAGAYDMTIAGNTLADRMPDEVVYYGMGGENPYSFNITRMDANGGWLASPIDLLKFAVRVDGRGGKPDLLSLQSVNEMTNSGSAAKPNYAYGWFINGIYRVHDGSLPGSRSIIVNGENGYSWAIIVNTRDTANDEMFFAALDSLPLNITQNVTQWPNYDFFIQP